MKTEKMSSALCFLALALLFFTDVHAQYSTINLGKRKNVVWSRNISPDNLGHPYTYYYPIYFQNDRHPSYTRSGVFGGRLRHELNLNLPEVADDFRRYKRDKQLSYVLLGGAATALFAWSYTSVDYMARTDKVTTGAFFRPPQILLLGACAVSFGGSIHLNLRGDKHLQRAVWHHNQHSRSGARD
ncbi:MAG: hypothetical protein RMJ33_12890 [Saprospiraceae bacterium]|nr:hypothetical protein [Saprospiraceae bacterium]MDW8230724.1 hypothetical protein [Saprospiraceae bacterium]